METSRRGRDAKLDDNKPQNGDCTPGDTPQWQGHP